MTEPTPPRPAPGPPRPGPGPVAPDGTPEDAAAGPQGTGAQPFADLDELPVADHVAVYEAEHARLQRQLGTIDQL